MKKIFSFILLIIFLTNATLVQAKATTKNYPECSQTNTQIIKILDNLKRMRFASFADKVSYLNQLFLNKPYVFNALGEGKQGKFDDNPLYRTDAFDCETYVDTIVALALANDLTSFQDMIRKIKYKNGKITFTNRNHFTCLDWNINNQNQGLTKDITNTIQDKQHHHITKQAITYIDKPNWYKNISIDRIRQQGINNADKSRKLANLRKQGSKFKRSISKIAYIPLSKIFLNDTEIDHSIIQQIPNGSIVEIIRPNWNLYKIIGTNLNVSHLGFVIWEHDKPFFIHASSEGLMIVKVPFIEYLKQAYKSPTIKGINIQIITPNA